MFEQIREWVTTFVAVMAFAGVGWLIKEVDRLNDLDDEVAEMRIEVAEYKAQYMITQERYNNMKTYLDRN